MTTLKKYVWRAAFAILIVLLLASLLGLYKYWLKLYYPENLKLVGALAIIIFTILLPFLSPAIRKVRALPFWIIVLGVYLASRSLWVTIIPTLPISDFMSYYKYSCGLAQGQGLPDGLQYFLNGFGFLFFMGFFYHFLGCSLVVGKVLNITLGLLSIPLIYKLGQRVGGMIAGRWAVVLFLLLPEQIMFTSVLGTEHLALFLTLIGCLYGIKLLDQERSPYLNGLISGIFLALAAIVRPAIVVYLGVICITILLKKLPARKIALQIAVLIGAYLLVNTLYGFGLSTNNWPRPSSVFSMAANLFYGSNAESQGTWTSEDAVTINSWPKDRILEHSLHATWGRISSYRIKKIAGLLYIKNFKFLGPGYYALWSVETLDLSNFQRTVDTVGLSVWIVLHRAFLLVTVLASTFLLITHRFSHGYFVLLGVLIMGTFMHLIFVVDSRYAYPFVPSMLILSAFWLSNGWQKSSKVSLSKSVTREAYNAGRIAHWDSIAQNFSRWRRWNQYYHKRLEEIYQFLISPGMRVLEFGSGSGDLLAAVKPSYGVGVDFSSHMVEKARQRHPKLNFTQADVHDIDLNDKFDAIILSDLINDTWDVEQIFRQSMKHCTPKTRLIINYYSRIWSPILALTERLGLSTPKLPQNWLVKEDVANLLYLTGFEVLRHQPDILWPLPLQPLEIFFNRFLAKIWPFNMLDLANITIARPISKEGPQVDEPRVSVIVPARNEAGNIPNIFSRVPEMGQGTELIFVEGHSQDNTFEAIQQAMTQSSRNCKLFRQTGVGKGDAVRLGFAQANGDILMILDADLTVPPEDLPRFYQVLISGKGELINGVRLVYPMQDQAMRFLNFIGNKFFSVAFTWLLGQPIKDTLCGTKALWRSDYERIAANRGYFGDFDPFGDFDLLFGAAKLNKKILDVPIRYKERTYGTTNIQRWKHGWLLLRMVAFAAMRIKFV